MADERDIRIRMDVCLPPEAASYADEIKDALVPFLRHGVVINEDQGSEERGYVEVERCGHRLGQECERVARWEVGRGRTV